MNEKRRLKIAYTTPSDVIGQSSYHVGTRYYIGKYLGKYLGDVDYIGPLDTIADNLFYRTKRRIYRYAFHKVYMPHRAPRVLDYFAKQIEEKIKDKHYDLIFSPDNIEISHLNTDIPIVFYTDAVFDSMVNFYSEFTKLCNESIRDGHNQEQAALDRAMLAIFSSQWAVDAAIGSYDVDQDKVKFVPFGANLPVAPDRESVIRRKPSEICNLLFIGGDWKRKGGPIAIQVVEELDKMGLRSKLFVCSLLPQDEPLNEFVEYVGLLDRNKAHENRELENLFFDCHFLILPTAADCTPGVFREAAAFGLPVITTDVGGNRSVVTHGKSGIILSKDAGAEEYASVIMENYTNDENYSYLCVGAREMFEQVLNWDSSISKVSSLIRNLLGSS